MTRAGAVGNLPWVRGTSQSGVKMTPRGAQHKEAITAELQMHMQKVGIKKFIETYGSSTFQSIAAITAGGIIAQETPQLDLQNEKLFGTSISSLPGMPQGPVYSDIEEPKKPEPLKVIPGIHVPKTEEQEELEKELKEPPKTYPPKPEDYRLPGFGEGSDTIPKILEPPKTYPPKLEDIQLPGFPDQSEEFNKPQIYYNEKVGKKMLTKESTDYRLQHKPRGPDDEYPVRLDNLTQTTTGESAGYPKDFYSWEGKRMYAPGPSFEGDEFGIANTESYNIINSVKGNPDAEVTIYRAVPNEKNITKINPSDFVTLSKRYVNLHAAGGYGRDGTDSGKVLELKVKVKDIYWDQNDVNEFGYFPEKTKDISKQTKELVPEKNIPKNLKDLVKRSVGQERGEKAIEKIYDDSIFDDILESSELDNIRRLEEAYTGGLADTGDAAVPLIFENSLLDQHEDYMDDYKDTLADAARETLGSEFKVYRLMEKEDALKMLIDGEFPNIKRLQEDEEGDESYQDVIINMMGEETPMSREFFSFSLSPKEALSFRFLSAGERGDKKDEDFILIEMKANPTDIVMRGHESEKDLILRVDGETAGSSYVTPKIFNVYDFKFSGKNQIELFENEQFKNFVIKSQKDDISEAAIQSKKLLEDKELDVSQQTKNLTSKIKNEITTWEDHFSTIEEATKAAKDVGGTLREFEEGVLYKKITFRQHNYGFDIYFDKKLIGGLNDVDPYKEDPNRKGNQKSYNLNYINEEGHDDEAFTTIDGQKYAKEKAKELIARDLLRETEESTDPLYPTSPTLRDVFQNLEYNKKGEPKDVAEGIEKTLKELEEYKEKNKKALGGLSEKELLFLKDLRVFGVPERASYTFDSKIKKLSEGEKVNLTKKEADDLSDYMFTRFESQEGTDEAIFDSTDDLELLDKKLRKK